MKKLIKKINQQQLADAVGVKQQSINKYENQNVEPNISVLIKYAGCFSVLIDYFIGRTLSLDFAVSSLMKDEKKLFSKYKILHKKLKFAHFTLLTAYQVLPLQTACCSYRH